MNKPLMHIITVILVLCMVLSCAACGEKPSNDKGKPQKPTSTPVTDDTSSNVSSNTSENNSSNMPSNTTSNTSSGVISTPTVTDEARPFYKPTSVTLGFYDTAASSYGFTWNTEFKPIEPVIQICEGTSFNESKCKEYSASVKTEVVYTPNLTYMHVCKVDIVLKQNTTYTYRAYDKAAKISSNNATFMTANLQADSFKFVHVSDSQVAGAEGDYSGANTGEFFNSTLSGIFKNKPNFMVHTGDIVEYSQYEGYWKNMLNFNSKYLMALPFMAISGNHETTYRAGSDEIFKHFNVKIPTQDTKFGYFYSFNYGNTKFIMLNTNNLEGNKLEALQYNWLVNELENNDKKWTIVSMHNPMYSVGKYGADPSKNYISLALRSQLTKLFADHNVDLVLQGHDHAYSKTYPIMADGGADINPTYKTENSVKYTVNPKGTIYAMHGPAGNQSRSPVEVKKNIYEVGMASKTNSWAEIQVQNDRLTVKVMYAENGSNKLAFSYGIIKD